MTLHRFFVLASLPPAPAPAWAVPLREGDVHHMARVLRLTPGDRIVLVDPDGREATGTLTHLGPDGALANVEAPRERRAHPRVTLAQGLTRRERMEMAIQKCTEIGVSEIVPVAFARSVVRLDSERGVARTERWCRIAEEAAKQSQRSEIPAVRAAIDLAGLVALAEDFDVVLVPWEEDAGAAPGIGEALRAGGATAESSVLVVIGPEGGLEAHEVAALEAAAGRRVSLGDTILRTETAAVVATAIAIYELGGLGGGGR